MLICAYSTIRQKLLLTRKYPSTPRINEFIAQMEAAYWLASNDPNFIHADTAFVYRIVDNRIEGTTTPESIKQSYRYWKFKPAKFPVELAEFMFFTPDGLRFNINPKTTLKTLFDNLPLTNATLKEDIVVDLGKTTTIEKIICIPRTDGNGIIPENFYELLYYDLNGWQSLGCRTAEDCRLEYNNVPANALLWLRNHTHGLEERVFTVKNGVIRFW